ncbi:MAG TPA: hypothetical protein VLN57_05470 [Xanthobacteraceae bacterium]|nr:hypothetical protein [Xanthobacteraceae bacterium]
MADTDTTTALTSSPPTALSIISAFADLETEVHSIQAMAQLMLTAIDHYMDCQPRKNGDEDSLDKPLLPATGSSVVIRPLALGTEHTPPFFQPILKQSRNS